MTPPQFHECVCGHLGGKHRDDGPCAAKDCSCARFRRTRFVYDRTTSAANTGKLRPRRGKWHPTKDSP